MQTVNVRDKDRGCEQEKKEVAGKEVRAPEREFDNLDDELPCRLRHRIGPEASSVPLARPPRPICLVVLELTREEHRDQDFVDGALNEDDSNQPKDGVSDIPQLQEPLWE